MYEKIKSTKRERSQDEMQSVRKQSNSITNVRQAYLMKWGKCDTDRSNFGNK